MMVIPANNQLECRHLVGMTEIKGEAFMVYQDETWISDFADMMNFKFCPNCGLELGEVKHGNRVES